MIGFLKGVVKHGTVLADGGGVGYVVTTPTPLVEGDMVELLIHSEPRDGVAALYGFSDQGELDVFRALLKVASVGPAAAMAVLSALGVGGLVGAVERKDPKAFAPVAGVGPRLAGRIISEFEVPASAGVVPTSALFPEVVSTLTALGYSEAAVRDALNDLEVDASVGEAEILPAVIDVIARKEPSDGK